MGYIWDVWKKHPLIFENNMLSPTLLQPSPNISTVGGRRLFAPDITAYRSTCLAFPPPHISMPQQSIQQRNEPWMSPRADDPGEPMIANISIVTAPRAQH